MAESGREWARFGKNEKESARFGKNEKESARMRENEKESARIRENELGDNTRKKKAGCPRTLVSRYAGKDQLIGFNQTVFTQGPQYWGKIRVYLIYSFN